MFLSDSLTWALDAYDVSGIKVICGESVRAEALASAVDKILEIAEDSDYDDIESLEDLLEEIREGEEE